MTSIEWQQLAYLKLWNEPFVCIQVDQQNQHLVQGVEGLTKENEFLFGEIVKERWQKDFQRVTQNWIAKPRLSQKSGKRLSYETYDLTGLLGNQTGNPSRGSRGEEERMLRCKTFEHQVLATVSIASGWSLSIWLICLLCRVTEVDSLSARAKVSIKTFNFSTSFGVKYFLLFKMCP